MTIKASFSINKTNTLLGVLLALFCVFLIYFGPLYSQLIELIQNKHVNIVMVEQRETKPSSAHHQHHQHHIAFTSDLADTAKTTKFSDHHNHVSHSKSNMMKTPSSTQSTHHNHLGHHHHGHNNGSINVLEACGYCSLLFHLSWLDVKTFDIIPLDFEPYPSVFYAVLVRKYLAIFTPLKPRAPPVVSH
ncbi:DUF2946 domain-containing protein [Marinomonas sp. THO17]|uniref:DUF2946 domain-containing protein n=1 Tax=Marinomonas sp. THO17 TaxID=3149048 RepID=UPI00336C2500